MCLFPCDHSAPLPSAEPGPTAIETPLGIVRLRARLSGIAMEDEVPTGIYRVSGNGRLVVWQRDDLDVELLICRPLFSPPLDWPVDECWGALWRVRAKALSGPILFWADWDEGYTWTENSHNSGQFLYAKNWGDGLTDVTIGTEDDEMLALRTRKSDYLPPEWETRFHDFDWMKNPMHSYFSSTGVPCPLFPLKKGQEIQIKFGVAWTGSNELSSDAASFAVEASPLQILAGGGCS